MKNRENLQKEIEKLYEEIRTWDEERYEIASEELLKMESAVDRIFLISP